jgi:hypothetical protein
MAVISNPGFAELAEAQRWDAEAFTPFLRCLDMKFADAPKLTALATVTHPAEIPRVYSEAADAVPFLRAQNIRPFLPDTENLALIPATVAEDLPTNRLQTGDVLVTRSGAFSGVAAVFLGESGSSYTSGEGLIIRSLGKIEGAYLAVFFNTNAGSALCRRAIYGSGQPHVGPKYLERVRVPRLGRIEKQVAKLVRDAHGKLDAAKRAYPEAETELLDRLGWAELTKHTRELSYCADLSALTAAARSDAEFFQPHCQRLRNRIRKAGGQRIGKFCPEPNRGVQPEFAENGTVLVLDSKSIRPQGVEPSSEKVTQAFHDSDFVAKGRVRSGDVLLNCTGRGTLGRAACYQLDASAVCDNHVAILRPNPQVCEPRYLALFLNSPAGLTQSEQFQTGSSGQLEIYLQHIQQFLVFLPLTKRGAIDLAWQKKLAAKVETATRAREEAKAYLAEAKRLVEEVLESQQRRS